MFPKRRYEKYVRPSEAEVAIQSAVRIELDHAPLRLLNTSAGLLCDRTAQVKNAYKASAMYKELLSLQRRIRTSERNT